jgi:hypothetical protein
MAVNRPHWMANYNTDLPSEIEALIKEVIL